MEPAALILGGCMIVAALILRSTEHTVWQNMYRAFNLFQDGSYPKRENQE
jgi:hypothetical protein